MDGVSIHSILTRPGLSATCLLLNLKLLKMDPKYKVDINKIRDQDIDSREQDREWDQEHQWSDLGAIMRTFRVWRGWYLKKNQPANYMRLICIKPNHEHWRNIRSTWNCRLQVFKGIDLVCDIRLSADAYDLMQNNLATGWGPLQYRDDSEYRIYKKQLAV